MKKIMLVLFSFSATTMGVVSCEKDKLVKGINKNDSSLPIDLDHESNDTLIVETKSSHGNKGDGGRKLGDD